MKRFIAFLVLLAGTSQALFAQTDASLFEPGRDYFHRKFRIDLGHGNQLQVELVNPADLSSLADIDSILSAFLHDLKQVRDSLSDPLPARKIDYRAGADGQNKLRFQSAAAEASSFLISNGELSALKLSQDTVFIIGETRPIPAIKKGQATTHLYRLGFFVNQLSDLDKYTGGFLNDKLKSLNNVSKAMWVQDKPGRWHIDRGDPAVSAERPAGYTGPNDDFLQLIAGVGLHNYKNYFTPSVDIGAFMVFRKPFITYKAGLSWETYFFFSRDQQNKLQTYRNHFVSLQLEARPLQHAPVNTPQFTLFQHISVGYIVKQKGDFMDPHTFRISTGLLSWYDDRIKLEPVLFFHDFFKGGSPGLSFKMSF